MNRAFQQATSAGSLPSSPDEGRDDGQGNEPLPFSWEALVPRLVHPIKVAVVEAIAYVGQPLAATELRRLLDGEFELSAISYHVVGLAKIGALVKVEEQQVRGATKKSYFFPTSH